MPSCCCCFGRRFSRRSSGRSSKDVNEVPIKGKQDDLQSPLSCNSYISEYYDAQENFTAPEATSPTCSTNATPRHSVGFDKSTDSPSTPKLQNSSGLANGHAVNHANGHPTPHAHHHQAAQPQPPANGAAHPAGVPAAAGLPSTLQPVSLAAPTADLTAGDSFHPAGASETSEEPLQGGPGAGPISRFASCLSILESIRIPGSAATPTAAAASASATSGTLSSSGQAAAGSSGGAGDGPGSARSRRLGKMEPGCSLRRRDMSMSLLDVREAWEECDDEPSTSGRPFMVRGPDYLKTKVKMPSRGPLYRLLAADVISSDAKLTHIARQVNLHSHSLQRPGLDAHLPPLLIITIMLPMYPAAIFGGNDGPSLSLVYYFGLPPDLNLATYENQTALGLLRRFATNGREADGTPTRDRFKLIPRVVNVDEWAQKGPLSPAEHKLLATYNDKPILTRPQHFFFTGPGYLEVDIDIHTYQFLARKAFGAYLARLKEVIFENAFVIQGNSPDELPEQVIAAARMYRIDIGRSRPLRDFVTPGIPAAPTPATAVGTGSGGSANSNGHSNGAAASAGSQKGPAGLGVNGHRRVGSIPEAPEEGQ